AEDGQKLGYTWSGTVDYWHKSAFVSFGSGQGVWESDGGPVLPFHSRNFKSVQQWLAPLKIEDLMPAMRTLRDASFAAEPPNAKPTTRKLNTLLDRIAAIGLDLKPAIGDDNRGLAWVAVKPGETQPRALNYDPSTRATLVQATNLGLSVKDSPQNTLVLVTRLDTAEPVAGAKVTIRDRDNKVFWTGTTDAKGLVIAPNTDLRRNKDASDQEIADFEWYALGELHFLVTAEKDGDVGYVASDWTEGITPWDFGSRWTLIEADPQLRGTVFVDRGVYKLGEEVHLKAVIRADEPDGMKLAPGTKLEVTIRDAHGKELETRTVTLGAWSSADWTWTVPTDAPLGTYSISAKAEKHRGEIYSQFLVAAYRRPDFRVDATLDGANTLAGTKLNGVISGRYLYGGTMAGKPVTWTYTKVATDDVPAAVTDRFPYERYAFLDEDHQWDEPEGTVTISSNEAKLDAKGDLRLTLDTDLAAGKPYAYQLEGIVTDVTRQQIAGRATFRVDPAPWYIGVKRPPYFAETTTGIDTEIIAAAIDGLAAPGVTVNVALKRIQWASVRQSEGEGFYAWESERKEIDAGSWTIETKATPVPLHIPITEGGEYLLVASASDAQGRTTETRVSFYTMGEGYTAWERYDHNRIDLIPEKQTYKPGDTARIMVKSPWEKATALLTTEREGVRTWTPFELTSTQQTITVPIREADIPNVFISVLLLKGRTSQDPGKDGSDPGKPAFRLGYVELKVEDETKRLTVDVKANRAEYRPGNKATIEVNVKDTKGKPSQAEVTLWAVDYGVLSLTGYTTPDVLETIYLDKALQVATTESRQRIISRRVLTPKGATDGGGGGRDAGPGTLRKDFRVLAFWVGSLVTDAKGRAKTEVTLPDSLSTYRIMAVAGDKQSRFGGADSEIRINKPLMLTPAWPRFLHVGDTAHFGGVVHNQLAKGGKATVSIESLDPHILSFSGGQTIVSVQSKTPLEVRFDATAKAVGIARVRMRVAMGKETDAFEQTIPVQVMISPETVAAYGEANPRAEEKLDVSGDFVPGFGGLRLDLASTQMVGLSEGARYLVEYPYGCAEQQSSRALALMLVTDLGAEFNFAGVEAGKQKAAVQNTLRNFEEFQCGDGGFAFWPNQCISPSAPFLTSYIVHVFQRGAALGYPANADVMERALTYLDQNLGQPKPENEGWMPAYTAWQAFAIKVLAEGGRNVDSHFNRVFEYRDRMPVFGISFLADALIAKGEKSGPRWTELERRINNAVLPEGGTAFVNELKDPYLLWFWNSNVRSTAIAMGTLVRHGGHEEIVKRMVRWLMQVRKDGRWGNTQENAWAMEALVDYYRKYESQVPDFTGTVSLGGQTIATETFKGRSTDVRTKQFSMNELLRRPGASSIVLQREGVGTMFYMMRLRYARNVLGLKPLDAGFQIERSYAIEGTDAEKTTFKAGDLIKVTLRIRNTKERRYVAVTDPLPAGTEPVETWFATTAATLVTQQTSYESSTGWEIWTRGGWDHVERHDDRVNIFATRLGEGNHTFSYLVRATTAGTFVTAPAHAEEMYEPEVFGRTGTVTVEVQR
ncbi:MAG TPA: MG2 domain-containing protein, partial [Thermoanaerobaculia bacterium]|nr:MG2 domain-containing protein [Thermoanaerobaculia bacterium]